MRVLKRHRVLILILLVLAAFLLYMFWEAVQMQGSVPLVKGYSYWHTSTGVIIRLLPKGSETERIQRIADRGEYFPTVGPDVDGYRVYEHIITGHVIKEVYPYEWGDEGGPPREQRPVGYFIIHVRDDMVYDGLTRQEWLEKLRQFGVTSEPKLFKPSIFDKLLRRNRPSDGD